MTARRALAPVLLLLPFVAAQVAIAATLRVPADHPTVWDAVAASTPDDTVLVAPGTYVHGESWAGGFAVARVVHPLTVRSESGPDVTVLALPEPPAATAAYGFFAEDVLGDFLVEGFTLQGPSASARAFALLDTWGAFVRDCRIEGFRGIAGAGVHADDTPVTLDACLFTACSAPAQTGVIDSWDSEPLQITASTLERCSNPLSWLGPMTVTDVTFERNEGAIAVLRGAGELTRCEFRENTVLGNGNELADLRDLVVTECSFVRNVAFGVGNRVSVIASNTSFERCLFADNYGDPPAESAAYLYDGGSFERNVVAGNRGSRAVRFASNVVVSCNLFWDNPDGHVHGGGPSAAEGWVVDPQFCDREGSDYSVMSTSPCLAPNSASCGSIGPFAEGCASRGFVVHTAPEFLQVTVDNVARTAPVYLEGLEGNTVQVALPLWQTVGPGRREVFDAWSDGGNATHDVIVGAAGERLTAFHHREHELAMSADTGGTVTPGTTWYPAGTPVQIEALPDFPAWFVAWVGTGPGAYSGPDAVVTVVMDEPMTQRATFSRYWEVTLGSSPAGARLLADGAEFEAPHVFHWRQGTQHAVEAYANREDAPGQRLVFINWSDGSHSRVRTVDVGAGPVALTANHDREYRLQMEVQGQGIVDPATGWYATGVGVPIAATAAPGWTFEEWLGVGDGSYSGPDAATTVTLDGPVTQTAVFRPAGAAFVLSLSDTDPDVAVTSTPLGIGDVHLWLECAEGAGIARFDGRAAGDFTVFAFQPAPGVINGGTATDVSLVLPGCPTGPLHLGTFVVQDQAGGSFCLEPTGGGLLEAIDCGFPAPVTFAWPAAMRIRGVTTDGTTPCESGTGCGAGGRVLQPSGSLAFDDDFRGPRPNPVVGSTTLEFALSAGGPARLDVYDVTGRLVRRLAEGPRAAGEHQVTWDRRDGRGARIPAGVYFVRLTASGFAETRKVLVLD